MPASRDQLESQLRDRILVIDGAMGTMVQTKGLEEADFRGERFKDHPSELKGNNELLSLTRPDVIRDIHDAFLEAGCDIVETNTFGSNGISQADYGLEDLVYEQNVAAAKIAREACEAFTEKTPDQPRFVAGAIGPTTKTLTLGPDVEDPAFRNMAWDELKETYADQTRGLIDGGSDIILVETIFDTLNAKAALVAVADVFEEKGVELPLMISVAITDASGRTLSGQTVDAFWQSVSHANPLSVGVNCSLGATDMRPHVAELAKIAPVRVSSYPNAGLPNAFGGYDEEPATTGALIREFAESGLVNIVGGCCGTTPGHIGAIAKAVKGIAPREVPEPTGITQFSGLETLTITPESNFQMIGERTNVTGSARFKRLIKNDDLATAIEVALDQVRGGANLLDVNMDEALLDSEQCMTTFMNLIASEPEVSRIPIMIDSSKWSVLESGLKCVQGKSVVNSISLKEGEADFLEKARLIRRFGAGVVVMAFDETGQADTTERKIEICERAYKLLVERGRLPARGHHLRPEHPRDRHGNRRALGVRDQLHRGDEGDQAPLSRACTSPAVSRTCPSRSAATTRVREAIHSAFLYHAIQSGMDMGIVNAGQLEVYRGHPEADLLEHVEDILFNRREDATERMVEFAETVKGEQGQEADRRPLLARRHGRGANGSRTPSSTASSTSSTRTRKKRASPPTVRST